MPLSNLDTQQKQAASSRRSQIVISAGAGSGKTSLLVGRYLYLLGSREVAMQEIAAITFTDKAASKMKAAVAKRARTLANEARDGVFWMDIATTVHAAPISTIHGFCNSLLRRFPVEAGIDPLYTIPDATTLLEMQRDTIDRHFRRRLDEAPERMGELLSVFGVRKLKSILRSLLSQRTMLLPWLDRTPQEDLAPGAVRNGYVRHMASRLARYRESIDGFHAAGPGDDKLNADIGVILSLLVPLISSLEEGGCDRAVCRELASVLAGAGRKGSSAKWEERGVDVRNVRSHVKGFRELLESIDSFFTHEWDVTGRVASLLIEEFADLEQRFLAAKKQRSMLDHDDTLIETWRLLRTSLAASREIYRMYRHILVDEFQDTDSLQMDILNMIAGNSSATLFTVGDPKQSIYRFRGADIRVFNEFKARTEVEFKTLRTNYRSAPGIIDFVNRVFGAVIGRDEPAETYDTTYTDMRPYHANAHAAVEISVFEQEPATLRRREEASRIAETVRQLHDSGDYRYGDMAVILRKGTATGVYENAFLERGVPFVNLTSKDAGDVPEALDIGQLLAYLSNPCDPALLSGVLVSPFCRIPPEALYLIRRKAGRPELMPRVLFDGFEAGDRDMERRLSEARGLLGCLLAMRDRSSIRAVLETALELSGYTVTVLADPVEGERSLAMIDCILDTAQSFESSGGTMEEYANHLLQGDIVREMSPDVETSDEVLNILTIHRAKGLEFKVVFLADITSRPNAGHGNMIMHSTFGPAFTVSDECGQPRNTYAYQVAAGEERLMETAEAKRLFYVGCTRAGHRLYISGGPPAKKADGDYMSGNWMSWLHAALEIPLEEPPEGDCSLFTYHRFSGETAGRETSPAEMWLSALGAPREGPDGDDGRLPTLFTPIGRPSPACPPVHLSPTEIVDYLHCPAMYEFRHRRRLGPTDSAGVGDGRGDRYGTFAHEVLEQWRFTGGLDQYDRISGRIRSAAPPEWHEQLRGEIARFTATPLYEDIRAARDIRNEEPFVFVYESVILRGAIDLLYGCDGRYSLLDYKTDAVDGETVADRAAYYRIQVGLYALAVSEALCVRPERMSLYFLMPGMAETYTFDDGERNMVLEMLSAAVAGLSNEEYSPRRGDHCRRCRYRTLCGEVPEK